MREFDEWQTHVQPLSPVRLPINHHYDQLQPLQQQQRHHEETHEVTSQSLFNVNVEQVDNSQIHTQTQGCGANIKQPNFLQKLYTFLALDPHPCPEVIYWASDSRQLVIAQPDRLVNEVLPKLFKHDKLSSFGRQLNIYGFSRLFPGRQFKDCHGNISETSVWAHPTLHRLSTMTELTSIKRRAAPKLFRTRKLANGQVVRSRAGPGVVAKALQVREEMAKSNVRRRRGGGGGGVWSSTCSTSTSIRVPTTTTVAGSNDDDDDDDHGGLCDSATRTSTNSRSISRSISVHPNPPPTTHQSNNNVNANVNCDHNDQDQDIKDEGSTFENTLVSTPAMYPDSYSTQEHATSAPAQVHLPFTPILTCSTPNYTSVIPTCTSTPTPVLHHPQPHFPQNYSPSSIANNSMIHYNNTEYGSGMMDHPLALPTALLSTQGKQQSSDTVLSDITEISEGGAIGFDDRTNLTCVTDEQLLKPQFGNPLQQLQSPTVIQTPIFSANGQVSTPTSGYDFQPFNMITTPVNSHLSQSQSQSQSRGLKVDTTTNTMMPPPPPPLPPSSSSESSTTNPSGVGVGLEIKYHSCPASIQTSPTVTNTSVPLSIEWAMMQARACSSVPQTPQQWKAFLPRPPVQVQVPVQEVNRPALPMATISTPTPTMNSNHNHIDTHSPWMGTGNLQYLKSFSGPVSSTIDLNMNMYSSPVVSAMPNPTCKTGELEVQVAPQDIICQSLSSSSSLKYDSDKSLFHSSITFPDQHDEVSKSRSRVTVKSQQQTLPTTSSENNPLILNANGTIDPKWLNSATAALSHHLDVEPETNAHTYISALQRPTPTPTFNFYHPQTHYPAS